nr:hypothetical protein [Bernardetiaceae bacterium]
MARYLLGSLLLILGVVVAAFGQAGNRPNFSAEALVNPELAPAGADRPYTLVINGGVNCGFCRYLIANLSAVAPCPQVRVVLLIEDRADTIQARMASELKLYPVYSNAVLKHRFRQGNEISPQTFLFKGEEEVLYVKG